MYRFVAKPKWVAFTVLVLAIAALCGAAARWQWSRYQFKVDRRDQVEAALLAAPLPVTSIDAFPSDEWTMVSLTGTFAANQQVVIRNRSQSGQPGVHVVAPLVLADGSAVLINRGFVAAPSAEDAVVPAAPSGQVTIVGPVRPSQRRSGLEAGDPATGTLLALNRVDVARISEQTSLRLAPGYIEADAAPAGLVPVDLPSPDLGSHLSYTGQWVLFGLLAIVGWVVVVRRSAQSQARHVAIDESTLQRDGHQ
jgi:cytochrome oxidase assembly protein ShyY1